MKTLAAIKNELFKDYLKIVSTDNLEQTLDNPLVPVPFTCVSSVQNPNAEALVVELNKFFEHKKIKNKDFLALDENETQQLKFLINLIQVSTTGVSHSPAVVAEVAPQPEQQPKTVEVAPTPAPKPEVKIEEKVEVKAESVKEELPAPPAEVHVELEPIKSTVPAPAAEESFAETIEEISETPFDEPVVHASGSEEIIEELGIPKNSVITLIKNEKITATIIDEKHIEFEGEVLGIIDGTKKAFKKAAVTGMALGLANWNYNGQNLKSLKDNK